MSWWKSTKRQRGWVKAHEAKAIGHYARREDDKRQIADALTALWDDEDYTKDVDSGT